MLVLVLAASYDVRWTSLPAEAAMFLHGGQGAHRSSHVPFTGDRAPIEAATFLSRGQGTHRGSHVPFMGDRAPIEAATFPSWGQGTHRNSQAQLGLGMVEHTHGVKLWSE